MMQKTANAPAASVAKSRYFHVILAGASGGGRYLTGLRQHIEGRGCVLDSLSTSFGLKPGEYRLKSHYRNLAEQVVQAAAGQPIRIYAHSLGGLEVLDFMSHLAAHANLPRRALEVWFISPPGVGLRGLRGVWEVGKRLYRVIKTLGLHDQYHIFPLAKEGDAATRKQRDLFLEEWLPRLLKNRAECDQLKRELHRLDSSLADPISQVTDVAQDDYHTARHKLLKGLVVKILAGEHLHDETHQHFLQQNTFANGRRVRLAARLSVGVELTAKVLKTLYCGIDQRILKAHEACRAAGINIKFGVVILGRDALVGDADYQNLLAMAASKNISIHKHIFKNEEHSSVAYNWPLIDALEALEWPSESVLQ